MNEENIDNRIERVIGKVASKKEMMDRWKRDYEEEQSRKRTIRKRWMLYGIPAAASVVVICVIGLTVLRPKVGSPDHELSNVTDIENVNYPVFRGGESDMNEISGLIESGKYDEAMSAIDSAMKDTVIDASVTPERREYLESVLADRHYELTWLKIQVLIKIGRCDEAKGLLKSYIGLEGDHKEEADKLFKSIDK
ncbi:MAG: hypothetical protein K2M31_06265 [Muribaculaceae bacterium]|nr:hypothetical protein [Muribaculaceae bacterium]